MCREDDDAVTVATTCGRPIADIELRIDAPADDGAGEVLLRGPNVMLGYLDDPEATAKAIDADGWLHTGDVGRVDEAGNLTITDRLKDMYICGGFNVYPAEIEQVLARLDGVAEAAVIGVPDERLGEVGKAFVVTLPGAELDEAAVIAYTREHLANFKTPRSVAFLDALPRNPGGKVVKPQLARDGLMDLAFDNETEEFRTEVRDFLAANSEHFPTKSYDTAEGFEQHRRWDKVLFDAGLSVIAWPREIRRPRRHPAAVDRLRGGVLPRRRARPRQRQRHLHARPDPVRARHGGTTRPGAAEDGQRRGDLGAGLVGAGVGQRPGVAALHRDQDRRRLEAQRAEDLELAGAVRRQGIRAVPVRPRGRAAQGPHLLHVRPEGRRRDGAADRAARRRHRVR